jgi:hypothetical protein
MDGTAGLEPPAPLCNRTRGSPLSTRSSGRKAAEIDELQLEAGTCPSRPHAPGPPAARQVAPRSAHSGDWQAPR